MTAETTKCEEILMDQIAIIVRDLRDANECVEAWNANYHEARARTVTLEAEVAALKAEVEKLRELLRLMAGALKCVKRRYDLSGGSEALVNAALKAEAVPPPNPKRQNP
jgi:hypothetical protein